MSTSWFLEDDDALEGMREEMRKVMGLGPDNKPLPKAPTVYQCIRLLAGHDPDGARVINGVGFNKFDVEFGHKLARKPESEWTEWDNFNGYKLIAKYAKTQLIKAGLDFSLIVPPTEPVTPAPLKEVVGEERFVMVHFEHIPSIEYSKLRREAWNLPGIRWDGNNRFRVSKDAASIPPLITYLLDNDFAIAPELLQELQWIVKSAGMIVAASKGVSLKEVGIEDWRIKPGYSLVRRDGRDFTPRPHQEVAVWYNEQIIRTRHHGVQIGDDMGLGKSTEALLTAHHMFTEEDWQHGLLILCPTHLGQNWEDEVRDRLPDRKVVRLQSGKMQDLDAEIVICPYSVLQYKTDKETGKTFPNPVLFQLQLRPWAGIACDESHYLKNEDAMRTIAVHELFNNARWKPGKEQTGTLWFGLGLSGSSVVNRPEEFSPQLEMLGIMSEFGSKYSFEREAHWKPLELHNRLREKGYVRREKADVLTCKCPDRTQLEKDTIACKVCGGIPIKQREVIKVELNDVERRKYDYAAAQFRKWLLEEYQGDMQKWVKSMRAELLVRIGKLSHKVAEGKLEPFIEWHRDFLEGSDQKVVIYAHHTDMQQKLAEAFPGCATIFGSQFMSDWTKVQNERKFQNDPAVRVLIYTTLGATGRNLTASSNTDFLELEWGPIPHDQAEDRCHRIGTERMVNSRFFVATGTIDEYRMALIDAKRKITSALNKGEVVDDTNLLAKMLEDFLAGKSPDSEALAKTWSGEKQSEADSAKADEAEAEAERKWKEAHGE